jgi:hypothetical protein
LITFLGVKLKLIDMKKTNFFAFGVLSLVLLSIGLPTATATTPYIPDANDVSGYTKIFGITYNASDSPLLTGVTALHVDYWKKDTTLVVSITIENSTNIFDQPVPASVKSVIDTIKASLPNGTTFKVDTLWDLLGVGLPAMAAILSLSGKLEVKTTDLDTETDYPYIDEGLAIYSENITIACAKDENLAIICVSFPFKDEPTNATLAAITNNLITQMNTLVSLEFDPSVIPTSEPKAAAIEVDPSVGYVLGQIAIPFGSNGPESTVPGYPLVWISLISGLAIVTLIKKKKTKTTI